MCTQSYAPKLSRLTIALLATGSLGSTALAQEPSASSAPPGEEIIVTGSRIRQTTGMAEPTPVTVMTMTELNELNPGSTIAEQLDELPQFFATPTAQRGGNAISTTAGGSYLNLRGMGLNRTLVLLDGTRVAPADANGSVNVDNFPAALMERVDIVTGGASAAYGADAVAGVVNFVLNREFEGMRTRFSTGVTDESDGENYNFSIAGGHGFLDDRLHLTGSVDLKRIDQIGPSRDRFDADWWQDWGLVRNPAYVNAATTPNVPQRIRVPHVFGAQSSPQGLIITSAPGFQYRNWTFTDDGTDIRPYEFGDYLSLTGVTTTGAPVLNNQSGGPEYAYYDQSTSRSSLRGARGNDVEQESVFLNLKYDINDRASLNFRAINGRSETRFLNQPSNMTIAGSLYAFTIYRENPYLPQRLADEMDRLGLTSIQMTPAGIIDGPGRINIYDNRGDESIGELTSYTLGFDFALNDNWTIEFDYQKGESTVETGILNVPRIDKFFLAMDAVRHPTTNEIVCNIAVVNPSPQELYDFVHPGGVPTLLPSPLSPYGVEADSPIGPLNPQECVPFNPFGLGNANQAAKDWILDPHKKQFRELKQDFAEVLATGVISQGWGAGPLSLAAGLTWRDEEFTQDNDPPYGERGVLNAPDLGIRGIPAGFAGPGNRSLHPFSAIGAGNGDRSVWEWFAELNMPIWEFDGGRRVGSTLAYRSSDYKRAGRQDSWKIGFDMDLTSALRWRATKSQDIREPNFAEVFLTGTGGGSVVDHFLGVTNNALTVLATSNPALGAETGDTITTGFVWQPTFANWIDGLQLSLDWYDIQLSNAVTPYGAQRIVDDCYNTGAASACDLIQRLAPAAGQTYGPISRILNQNINADLARTRGVDLEFVWSFEPDFIQADEGLQIRGLLGRLHENSTTTAAGARQDQAGSQTRPVYSGFVSGSYTFGNWGLMLQGSYYHRTMNNITWVSGVDIDDNWIDSQTTFNFATSYSSETAQGLGWRLSFNINNLTDAPPSIVANATGQSIVLGHDALGRRYQLSFNMDF